MEGVKDSNSTGDKFVRNIMQSEHMSKIYIYIY